MRHNHLGIFAGVLAVLCGSAPAARADTTYSSPSVCNLVQSSNGSTVWLYCPGNDPSTWLGAWAPLTHFNNADDRLQVTVVNFSRHNLVFNYSQANGVNTLNSNYPYLYQGRPCLADSDCRAYEKCTGSQCASFAIGLVTCNTNDDCPSNWTCTAQREFLPDFTVNYFSICQPNGADACYPDLVQAGNLLSPWGGSYTACGSPLVRHYCGVYPDSCSLSQPDQPNCDDSECNGDASTDCSQANWAECICTVGTQCPPGAPVCIGGQCGCLTADDCSAAGFSKPACQSGICTGAPGCASDADCKAYEHCVNSSCADYSSNMVTCSTSADCPPNWSCADASLLLGTGTSCQPSATEQACEPDKIYAAQTYYKPGNVVAGVIGWCASPIEFPFPNSSVNCNSKSPDFLGCPTYAPLCLSTGTCGCNVDADCASTGQANPACIHNMCVSVAVAAPGTYFPGGNSPISGDLPGVNMQLPPNTMTMQLSFDDNGATNLNASAFLGYTLQFMDPVATVVCPSDGGTVGDGGTAMDGGSAGDGGQSCQLTPKTLKTGSQDIQLTLWSQIQGQTNQPSQLFTILKDVFNLAKAAVSFVMSAYQLIDGGIDVNFKTPRLLLATSQGAANLIRAASKLSDEFTTGSDGMAVDTFSTWCKNMSCSDKYLVNVGITKPGGQLQNADFNSYVSDFNGEKDSVDYVIYNPNFPQGTSQALQHAAFIQVAAVPSDGNAYWCTTPDVPPPITIGDAAIEAAIPGEAMIQQLQGLCPSTYAGGTPPTPPQTINDSTYGASVESQFFYWQDPTYTAGLLTPIMNQVQVYVYDYDHIWNYIMSNNPPLGVRLPDGGTYCANCGN